MIVANGSMFGYIQITTPWIEGILQSYAKYKVMGSLFEVLTLLI